MFVDQNRADTGLLTWHHYSNVGSNLQAYAMQYIVTEQKRTPVFLNYRGKYTESKYKAFLKKVFGEIDSAMPNILPESIRAQAFHFQNKYLKMTKELFTDEDLFQCSKNLSSIVCGSDQIWAPNVYNPVYQLQFCGEGVYKCAYAASVGLPSIPKELIPTYRKNLQSFHYITVRERQGAELLSNILDKEIPWVLDPTLLVPRSEWEKISKRIKTPEKYLFCYFLGENPDHRKMAQNYAKQNGLEIICCSNSKMDKTGFGKTISHMGPQEFLGYLLGSDAMFTDSFHGILFSIIFRKNFYAVHRFKSDDKVCQNSRVDNILEMLCLSDRCLQDGQFVTADKPIDYAFVERLLKPKQIESELHLRRMLNLNE